MKNMVYVKEIKDDVMYGEAEKNGHMYDFEITITNDGGKLSMDDLHDKILALLPEFPYVPQTAINPRRLIDEMNLTDADMYSYIDGLLQDNIQKIENVLKKTQKNQKSPEMSEKEIERYEHKDIRSEEHRELSQLADRSPKLALQHIIDVLEDVGIIGNYGNEDDEL